MHTTEHLAPFPGSYVLRGEAGADIALVFVHGFAGNAVSTWNHLQHLVDSGPLAPAFARADLFFYDYASARRTIADSADRLRTFVEEAVVPADDDAAGAYARVHFVGHSTGAVVIRQLILDLLRSRGAVDRRLLASPPLLFAPAQFGFRHSLPLMLFVPTLPFLAVGLALWGLTRGKVLADLQPDSPVLTELQQQTLHLQAGERAVPALSALSVWGSDENIVFIADYEIDTRLAFARGYNHFAVCKPLRDAPLPLHWVSDAIDRPA